MRSYTSVAAWQYGLAKRLRLHLREKGSEMSVDSMKPEVAGDRRHGCAGRRSAISGCLSLGAMAVAFVVAYLPTYIRLANGPWQTEQEGHGPLIMLAAAWLAWQQRGKLAQICAKARADRGLGHPDRVVAAHGGHPVAGHPDDRNGDADPCSAGLPFADWRLASRPRLRFPLAFLIFSVPPPGWILDAFTVPLKAWVSDVVTNFLYALGYPIAQNGVMIMIGSYELMVKDACSGMNSIFALSAIGIFYVYEFVTRQLDQEESS